MTGEEICSLVTVKSFPQLCVGLTNINSRNSKMLKLFKDVVELLKDYQQ